MSRDKAERVMINRVASLCILIASYHLMCVGLKENEHEMKSETPGPILVLVVSWHFHPNCHTSLFWR